MRRLDEKGIACTLCRRHDDGIVVKFDMPGERWEVEYLDYNGEVHVEIERFRGDGKVYDESALAEVFAPSSSLAESPVEGTIHHDAVARK